MDVYILALLSPFAFALGTVLQQRGALQTRAREGDIRFLTQILRKPVWFLGVFVTVVAFGLQAAALLHGSLALVQALQTLSLVLALPLGIRLTHQRVGSYSLLGAGITVAGLIVFVILGEPQGGISRPGGTAWLASALAITTVTALLTWLAFRRRGPGAAALFATAAGVCFALQAAVTKVVVNSLGDGWAAVLLSWPLYALVLAAGVGFALQQASLKTGYLAPSMAALNAATLAVSVLLGITVFHEALSQGGDHMFFAAAGLLLAIGGVVVLAHSRHANP